MLGLGLLGCVILPSWLSDLFSDYTLPGGAFFWGYLADISAITPPLTSGVGAIDTTLDAENYG